MRARAIPSRTFPVLTAVTLSLTVAATATRLFGDGVLDALRRDPTALGHGQAWRLLSPVLVQSDDSLVAVLGVFALCAVIGTLGERLLGRRRWIALYLVGALAGHGIGEAFQPHQGGTSVAFFGILGGLAAIALFDDRPELRLWRVRAAIAIPLSVLDTALGDIHGVAFLAGLAVASVWAWRGSRAAEGEARRSGGPRRQPPGVDDEDLRMGVASDPSIGRELAVVTPLDRELSPAGREFAELLAADPAPGT